MHCCLIACSLRWIIIISDPKCTPIFLKVLNLVPRHVIHQTIPETSHVHHVKGYKDPSTYVKKGCLKCDTICGTPSCVSLLFMVPLLQIRSLEKRRKESRSASHLDLLTLPQVIIGNLVEFPMNINKIRNSYMSSSLTNIQYSNMYLFIKEYGKIYQIQLNLQCNGSILKKFQWILYLSLYLDYLPPIFTSQSDSLFIVACSFYGNDENCQYLNIFYIWMWNWKEYGMLIQIFQKWGILIP